MVSSQVTQKPWPHKGARDLGTQRERMRLCLGGNKRVCLLWCLGMYGELPMGVDIPGRVEFKLNPSLA